MIWLLRLSKEGVGVKNSELASALDFSKPSVHNMLKSLAEMGIVKQETFGLAHFTKEGRTLAIKYACCFEILKNRIENLCGIDSTSESAICGILADMSPEIIDKLFEFTQRSL